MQPGRRPSATCRLLAASLCPSALTIGGRHNLNQIGRLGHPLGRAVTRRDAPHAVQGCTGQGHGGSARCSGRRRTGSEAPLTLVPSEQHSVAAVDSKVGQRAVLGRLQQGGRWRFLGSCKPGRGAAAAVSAGASARAGGLAAERTTCQLSVVWFLPGQREGGRQAGAWEASALAALAASLSDAALHPRWPSAALLGCPGGPQQRAWAAQATGLPATPRQTAIAQPKTRSRMAAGLLGALMFACGGRHRQGGQCKREEHPSPCRKPSPLAAASVAPRRRKRARALLHLQYVPSTFCYSSIVDVQSRKKE